MERTYRLEITVIASDDSMEQTIEITGKDNYLSALFSGMNAIFTQRGANQNASSDMIYSRLKDMNEVKSIVLEIEELPGPLFPSKTP